MNTYLSCSSLDLRSHLDNYNHIREVIQQLKLIIVYDWIEKSINQNKEIQFTDTLKKDIYNQGIGAINECDFIIADVSLPSSSVGYQIGYALAKKIPVLCIYSVDFGSKVAPQVIQAIHSPLLVIKSYNKENIKEIISSFIKNLPTEKLLKFNFIITQEISHYLDWGASNQGLSKSDFLRMIVEKVIREDDNYINN